MEKEYQKSVEIAKDYLGISLKTKLDAAGETYGAYSEPDFAMLEDYMNRGGEDEEYIQYLLGNRLDPRD